MYDHIKLPPMFKGCSFGNTTWTDGTLLTAKDEPIILNPRESGNIIFPEDWSNDQRAAFRQKNNMPGPEWS
jgi:hypothetical protein